MASCMEAHPDMTPEAMMELIAQCPPGPWPNAWGTWDNTIEAHRRLIDQYIDNLMPSRVATTRIRLRDAQRRPWMERPHHRAV
ncbi:MAG: hypothetical protein ACK52S_18825 [Pirellula sp.]|jgi:hypothetical protein